jgi:ATP-dependent DNA helicase RecG
MNKRQFEQILKSGEGARVEFNSIIHRDYFEIGARVMVEIFDDRVEISNPGELLVDEKEFGKKVISVARNPVLFDIFHRLQLIEKVGTGVQRIIEAIQKRKLSIEFYFGRFFSVTFLRPVLPGYSKDIPKLVPDKIAKSPLEKVGEDIAGEIPRKYPASTPHDLEILSFCEIPKKRNDIQEHINLKDREYFRLVVLKPLLENGLLKPLIPEKPKSSRQKYVITEKGKNFLTSVSSVANLFGSGLSGL